MFDDRSQADRILVAQLTGEARHRVRWRELSGDEEAAAVAGLRELADGRADLFAEVVIRRWPELPNRFPAPLGTSGCQFDNTHDVLLSGRHLRLNPVRQALGGSWLR